MDLEIENLVSPVGRFDMYRPSSSCPIRPRRIVGAGRDLDLAAELTVLRHAAFTPARANNSNIIICSALADPSESRL